jgi:outer membrane protein OmpA-like peptidoglycan-associated protein
VPIGQRPDPAAASPPPDVPEKSALPPVASAAEDGRFMSYDLPPGRVVVRAARDGYEAQDVTVDVQVGDTVVQEIRLTPEVRTGTLSLRVTDDRGVPLKATVWVSGPSGTVALESGGDGRLEQTLPEGDHTVAAVAPGRLARGQRFAVPVRKKVAAALSLPALPGELAARLDGEAIVLLQPVGFTGADVDPTTTAALDHAAHIILTQPGIGRIRVEGHTATDGAPEVNMEASQARAESALRYLVQRGVPASRLTAQGFGDMKPIAPNFTKQGREKNRRIELKVLGPTSGGRS